MKIVTFNIRYATFDDQEQYQAFRRPFIAATILRRHPDVIGFQELNMDSWKAMKGWLPGYDWVGYGTGPDCDGESNRICFDAQKYDLLATDQLWLSPTPRVPGSRYTELAQSSCPRVCTWVKLRSTVTGKRFYVFNAHLDHMSLQAILRGMDDVLRVAKKVREEDPLPVFIMGDYNFCPDSPAYRLIEESGLQDITKEIPSSFHDYGRLDHPDKSDYILTDVRYPYTVTAWTDRSEKGLFLSDHDPIEVEIEI